MRALLIGFVFLLVGATRALPADNVGATDLTARDYESTWDPRPGEETMRLGEKSASFSVFKGQLILEYAGIMPPETGWSYPNTRVYRILNGADFFQLNKGNPELQCRKSPRWLGVAPAGGQIRLSLLETDDYRTHLETRDGPCMDAPYRLLHR
jgi:hypothetical protein